MALIKTRRPLGGKALMPVFPAFDEIENRMRTFFDNPLTPFEENFAAPAIGWVPAMDIIDTAKELLLIAELPGLEKKDVEISIEDGILTLRGEKLEERKENGAEKKYYLFERTFGSFNRTFTLPRFIDANKIAAEFDKGVLKIHLPKTAEAETKGRKIDITVK